ncbi:MAG: alpha/beta hydrolase [Rhodobiaceae bacterium]|nr:alpha/beta hydrolase [Rhodobiaceae bacterium]MCC0048889.1 alpha/beta hydrolase [Rhodobiaceae bacterium]
MTASTAITPEKIVFAGSAGNRLAGDVWGAAGAAMKAPALLLHGGGQTRRAWDRTARDLSRAGFVAITVDQRGHGESDWLDDGSYAFADYGADAVRLGGQIAERFGTVPVVIGASLGGLAAMLAEGEAGPDFWHGLVLVDITPQMDPGGVDKIQSFMGAAMAEGFASVEEAADAVAAYLPHRPRPKSLDGLRKNLRRDPDGRYRWHWDPRFLNGPRSINTDGAQLEAATSDALRATGIPVLLVRGASSELITQAHAEAFKALAPHAEVIDVGGAGHMVAGDRNDVFSAAICSFMAKIGEKPEV